MEDVGSDKDGPLYMGLRQIKPTNPESMREKSTLIKNPATAHERRDSVDTMRRRVTFGVAAAVSAAAIGRLPKTGYAEESQISSVGNSGDAPDLRATLLRDFTLSESVRKAEKRDGEIFPYKDGKFECINSVHDAATDAQAFAFREVKPTFSLNPEDGFLSRWMNKKSAHKNPVSAGTNFFDMLKPPYGDELLLCFPGRSDNFGTPEENAAVIAMFEGQRSPQIVPIQKYVREKVIPYLQENPSITKIRILGHSMGSASAITAKYFIDKAVTDGVISGPVQVKATLFEPFAASQSMYYRVLDAMGGKLAEDGSDDKRAAKILAGLKTNLADIHSNPRTFISKMPVGIRASAISGSATLPMI